MSRPDLYRVVEIEADGTLLWDAEPEQSETLDRIEERWSLGEVHGSEWMPALIVEDHE